MEMRRKASRIANSGIWEGYKAEKFGLFYEMYGISTYSTYSINNGGKKTNVMAIYHLG